MAIVSDQPAAAKGKVSRELLEAVHARVVDEVQRAGGVIASSHLCLHRAEDGCGCRKPATGLLLAAFEANPGFSRTDAWMVGDAVSDVQAGKAAGLHTALIGRRFCAACEHLADTVGTPDCYEPDLSAFVERLLGAVAVPRAVRRGELRVRVFADGADLETIRRRAADPLIAGFTTNPSLMRKAGVLDYEAFARAALEATGGRPLSIEVVADTAPEIERQARRIHGWGPNAYVKIPVTTTRGEPLWGLAGSLSREGVKVNVTAVLTLEQVAMSAAALRGGAPSVISVLAGRVADAGVDPVSHMRAALSICRAADRCIELLWASPREVYNVVQASDVGVDIITVTDDLLQKLGYLGKALSDVSLEMVRALKADADVGGYQV